MSRYNYLSLLKRISLSIAAFGCACAVMAQGNPPSSAITADVTENYGPYYYGDIIRVDEEDIPEIDAIMESIGGIILNHRDNLYLVMMPFSLPTDNASAPGALRARKKYGYGERQIPRPKATPAMDVARTYNNAPSIYDGSGLPQAFDGKGVVVGFSDTGFDTRHVNFRNADDTESRVRIFSKYDISEGEIVRLTNPDTIHEYWSDNENDTHATHVAGIMAGRGTPSPYIGMAPAADICATTSDLSDVGILAGVEDIIAYAKSVGKPCVINLSLGNYNGPHDGTSLFCQYLDKCASDAIIVLSSGNVGNTKGHIGYTFKAEDEKLKFRLNDSHWAYTDIIGYIDIYSADATPVKLQMFLMDTATGGMPVCWTSPEIDFTKTRSYVISTDPEFDNHMSGEYNEEFAKYFDGEIQLYGNIDRENGRFCATLYCNAHTDILVSDTQKWGRYQMGGYVIGNAGQKVDLFADCQHSSFKTTGISVQPDTNFSISDMATGHNTISVGAYWTQGSIAMYNGNKWGGGTPGDIAAYSSYATLDDGRVMPETIAPGGPIVSSTSGKYVQQHGSGGCSWNHESDYWDPNTGTSMAAPYVAGAIATWLQANPLLTVGEVKEILKATNTTDTPVSDSPAVTPGTVSYAANRLANGFFHPYDGLRMVVDRLYSDVQTILGESLFAKFSGNALVIANPDNRNVLVEVFSVDGSKISSLHAGNDSAISIDRDNLTSGNFKGVGICLISASGAPSKSLKIIL